ncbi:hypothetical protein M422DRAFT_241338 [Sphaerobolus stellatus SS14]|nr:hypothetical protein M422DRAFT_241338 [Sphaerobolus stellatus SS14]
MKLWNWNAAKLLLYVKKVYPAFARDLLQKFVPGVSVTLKKMMDEDLEERSTAAEALEILKQLRDNVPSHIRFSPEDEYPAELLTDVEKTGESFR